MRENLFRLEKRYKSMVLFLNVMGHIVSKLMCSFVWGECYRLIVLSLSLSLCTG